MDLTILETLYLFLTIFTIVIGILLSVVLYKLIKILNVLIELVEIYNKIKQIIMVYNQIPEMILDYVKNIFFGKKE